MFPEYDYDGKRLRNLFLLEEGLLYDTRGRRLRYHGYDDLCNFLRDNNGALFTGAFAGYRDFPFLAESIRDRKSKCICTKRGRPLMVRVSTGAGTRWIIDASAWEEVVELETLDRIYDVYKHFDIGFAPTPGSLGRLYMRYIYDLYGISKHTGLCVAAEHFIRRHAPSPYVLTRQTGYYVEGEYADITGAYLAQYMIHPDGPATFFRECAHGQFAAYFARCTVEIKDGLSLGPFPRKNPRGVRKKYGYPTTKGVYDNIYLWNFQVEDCLKAGCEVRIHEGWGWNELTTDNMPWVQHAWDKRQKAPTDDCKTKSKAVVLSGIGTMGMDRSRYILIEDGGDQPGDRCLIDAYNDPIDLWVREEKDNRRALMLHWWDYTRQITSSKVYNFALQYAQCNRLLAIDHDMILVRDEERGGIRKFSTEAATCPVGSWIWRLLHNVYVMGNRRFKSDELVHLPGIHREPESELVA